MDRTVQTIRLRKQNTDPDNRATQEIQTVISELNRKKMINTLLNLVCQIDSYQWIDLITKSMSMNINKIGEIAGR